MAKLTLTDITSGYQSTTVYNANNTLIETALENTLSRDGTTPNTMSANLDLNSNKIVNVTDGTNNQDAVTLAQLNAASVVASTAAATAVTVADAGGYYVSTTVEAALQEVFTKLADTANGEGASLIGVEDSAANWAATDVEAVLAEMQTEIDAITAITAVVDDTTPQLGGDLDLNSNDILCADQEIKRPVLTDYGIKSNSLTVSANAVAVNMTTGNAFEIDLEAATGAVTITLSNPPASGTYGEAILKVQQDSTADRTITWAGGSFVWAGGSAPTMSTGSDAIDIYTFKTWDGGTTYYASAAQDFS